MGEGVSKPKTTGFDGFEWNMVDGGRSFHSKVFLRIAPNGFGFQPFWEVHTPTLDDGITIWLGLDWGWVAVGQHMGGW